MGLSAGACLSSLGHDVTCIDVDVAKINMLQSGKVPILEDGLEQLVVTGLANGNLRFMTDLCESIAEAEFVFLCLPTPQQDDGSADLSYVMTALNDVRDCLRSGAVVVNKSTVPVGTAIWIRDYLNRDDIEVVSNPEFLRQGTAVRDFLEPTRVVVGGDSQTAVEAVADLYRLLKAPILKMNSPSAEMLKYAANAMLATKLTFVNAIADICEAVGADIFDVAQGIGLDPRIGPGMLKAGPGWGGSCFPKDTRALLAIAAQGGYDFSILRDVVVANDRHYERIVRKVEDACGGSVLRKNIAAWGLTFKAGTDDLRDSPAIKILSSLKQKGARISAFDPSFPRTDATAGWIETRKTAVDACVGADVLVVLTEWSEFTQVVPAEVMSVINGYFVVDSRNVLDASAWREAGFSFQGVGR